MGNIVVTIGRQYGSGGRELGERLAKELGIPFYDKELVELAAKKSDMSEDVLKNIDEKATNSFLYSLVTGSMRGSTPPFYYEMPLNDRLFVAQSEVIKSLAAETSCVIVGRCADYILADTDFNCANIFVYAPMTARIDRVQKMYDTTLSPSKAKEKIVKTDKTRKTYYNYYSNQDWGKMDNYHLCLDTSAIGMDNAVEIAKNFVRMKMGD